MFVTTQRERREASDDWDPFSSGSDRHGSTLDLYRTARRAVSYGVLDSIKDVNELSREEAGPIARAIGRDTVPLSAVQHDEPTDIWSQVHKLEPGTEITVTVRGSQAGKRNFVSADASGVTVLNLAEPALPVVAARVLHDLASKHPGYFIVAGTRRFADRQVRVGPDGVFFEDQKVAELGQIVERIAQRDVVEIAGRLPHLNALKKGAIIGASVGGGIGGLWRSVEMSTAAM